MRKNSSLKEFIYRTLIQRLVVAAILISGLFAALSFYHSKGMINNAIIQVSTVQIGVIKGRFQEMMARPGIDQQTALRDAINYPPDTELHIKEGEFVYAILHNKNREKVGIYQHESIKGIAAIKRYVKTEERSNPDYTNPTYKSITINGQPYLEIHTKLLESGDGSEIFIRTFFAISEHAVRSIKSLTIKTVLYTITIVLTTTILLYPVIILLFGKLSQFSSGLLTAHLQTMEALGAAIAKRDSATNYHNYRVTLYAISLAENIGLKGQNMQSIIKGSFLHDVGKIGIKDNILLTPERYSASEFKIMKQHVGFGLDIIKRSSWLQDAAAIVGNHHEKYDGSGYPAGIKGTQIPLGARIFALADVFDALTSKRPYKEPYTYKETMNLMRKGRASHFDPEIFDNFQKISESLYREFGGREDDGLKEQLQRFTDKYFHSGINTLSL